MSLGGLIILVAAIVLIMGDHPIIGVLLLLVLLL